MIDPSGYVLHEASAGAAEIIPIEIAFERNWSGAGTFVGDVSAFFLCGNRNKRSLAIDVKHAEGRNIILKLVECFDVVLENYRPGVMERLGLGYEQVREANPRIVYASASGYGSTGPSRDNPGQDLLVQARAGLIAATGVHIRSPTAVGCATVDQHGAALLAMGVLGAYVRALRSGVGSRVEASLLNAGIDLQAEALTLYYSGQRDASVLSRNANLATWFHAAPYGVYRVADAHIVLSLNNYPALARALADERLYAFEGSDAYKERDAIAETIAAMLSDWTFEEISAVFDAAGIFWYQKVQNYDDLRNDPQVLHNGTFIEVPVGDESATLVNHPLRYDGKTPKVRQFALSPGQHTAEVLAEIGL